MSLPHARYIVVHHDGEWKLNLDNRYYGPYPSEEEAKTTAINTAKKAAEAGYPASALLLQGTAFETLWTSEPA